MKQIYRGELVLSEQGFRDKRINTKSRSIIVFTFEVPV